MPKPGKKEKQEDFISRCMGDETMNKDFKDNKQRYAVCMRQWDTKKAEEEEPEDALLERLTLLRQAMATFGSHTSTCALMRATSSECDCGFTHALML